jgi:dihydrofolate synthase/folylpolyglutamate synthase
MSAIAADICQCDKSLSKARPSCSYFLPTRESIRCYNRYFYAMTYKESLDYLYTQLPMFQRIGPKAFKKDLDNIKALAARLDHPEKSFQSIHIAGTNGKGTTAHVIAAILQAAGYKVGLYTSPHYRDFRERIKINGQFIDKKSVRQFVQWFIDEDSDIKASFFEITVAMAFTYFREQQVDVAVIETGLGGRLDSTNIVTPLLSIITNISYDHTNFLGDTLELIAAEKAGIIKEGIPVLIGRRQEETASVFRQRTNQLKSPLFYVDEVIKSSSDLTDGNNKGKVEKLDSPFFEENKRTALAAIKLLDTYSDLKILNSHVNYALKHVHELTYFVGRWMILSHRPMTIGDSAHNLDGFQIALSKLEAYPSDKQHFVLGFVNDKDLTKVLQLFPTDAQYYFAKADIPRGLDASELQTQAMSYGLNGKAYSTVRKAYAAARASAGEADLIYIGGSIFTLAEVI